MTTSGVVGDHPMPDDESIRDVIPDELVRKVADAADQETDCDHLVCWTRSIVEAAAPILAADEDLLRRIRAVTEADLEPMPGPTSTEQAIDSVAGTLLSFQPLTIDPDGTGGASFEDPDPAERRRRAEVIVNELIRAGLI